MQAWEIFTASTPEEILACRDAMLALRPHIAPQDFLPRVQQQYTEGYRLTALRLPGGTVPAVMGYRKLHFLTHGAHYYIDDLSTLPASRGQGYGRALLHWLYGHARAEGIRIITLDSGHARYGAHRLYLREGFEIVSHHFRKMLD